MIAHGGNLELARSLYGEPQGGWIDLSTGINPFSYPFSSLTQTLWHNLPDPSALRSLEQLISVNTPRLSCLCGSGSQSLLRLLPQAFPDIRTIAILSPTYGEHEIIWQQAGINPLCVKRLEEADGVDALIFVRPNNPTASFLGRDDYQLWLARQKNLRLCLIDEAFIDCYPENSLISLAEEDERLVILRSLGKFYGLAGLRLSWFMGQAGVIEPLRESLGPWPVSGPAIAIAHQALSDKVWQNNMRITLKTLGKRRDQALVAACLSLEGSTPLFALVSDPDAETLHYHLARKGLWTRRFSDSPEWIRIGLPGDDIQWSRFEQSLKDFRP